MVGLCALETRTSVKGAAWSAYQRRITFMEGNHLGNARAITRPGTLSNCEIVQALVKKSTGIHQAQVKPGGQTPVVDRRWTKKLLSWKSRSRTSLALAVIRMSLAQNLSLAFQIG
jgi:hypothetical protein